MYIQLCIFILLSFFYQSYSQDCKFTRLDGTSLSEDELNFGIVLPTILDTTQPGKVLLELNTTNVEKINGASSESISNEPYINVSLSLEGIFNLTLTDHFLHYEELEMKESVSITVEFLCTLGNNKKIIIYQPIEDTNNHYPEFVNAPYRYNLSMPYPKDIPIDLFGKISARDIDLTNKMISFSLEESNPMNQGLNAEWSSSDSKDKKLHYATLITTAALNYGADVTFHLFAKDSGSPPNISNTTITILIDKPNSVPRFAEPIYIADYSNLKPENADGTIFSFNQGDVSLSGGVDETVKYTIKEDSGEYQKNFKLDISSDYSTVRLILMDPPEKFFNESFVLLTLTAKKSGAEVTTVLHISLPGRSTSKTTTSPESTTPTSATSEITVTAESSAPTTSATATSPTTTEHSQNDNDSCICTDCKIPIIVLSVLIAGITVGLVSFIVVLWRQLRTIPKVTKNGTNLQEVRGEMTEVHRDSNGTTPVGYSQRSVAFNDTVEEIDAVRL